MATQYANGKIVTDGLVFCLDAADRNSYVSGSNTWFNLVGSNNATLTNGPTFNSGSGGSIVFDGIDDYAVASFANLGFDVPWTLGCWFNTSVSQSNNVGMFNLSYFPELMMDTTGKVFVWNSVGSSAGVGFSYPFLVSPNSYNNGQWHYAVGSYTTGGLVKLYVDGALVNSASYAPNGVRAIYNGVYVGMEFNNGAKVFNGRIALGQVYNRQITDQEVLQNYNAQKSRFGL